MGSEDSAAAALQLDIRALTPDELPAAVAVLADGMANNPLHLRVFGADPKLRHRRLARFFHPLLAFVHANGTVTGAFVAGDLIGVLGMLRPGRCRPGPGDKLRIAGALLTGMPPSTLVRLYRWLTAWARNDPVAPHWHIGPLVVRQDFRRRGIGRRLMQHCCRQMDAHGAPGWLETDMESNAGFYRTLGFALIRQETVLGLPTWFMRRAPGDRVA